MPSVKSKPQTWMFASDFHGDNACPDSVEHFFKHLEILKPDIRVFGGDLFDFRAIRKGASAEERGESMSADVEAGLGFLERFQPHVFLRGNHDERMWDASKSAEHGIIRDAATDAVKDISKKVRGIGAKMLPYDATDGVYSLGKLSFIHGFHAGLYATKKHAEVYAQEGGIVLHGHTHGIQQASIARRNGAGGMSVGCLARLDMEYNRHQTGRLIHANGWAYGVVWKGGFEAMQASRSKDGSWITATGFGKL